jgi:nicotinate-nucleotide adenylyltransferase
MNNQARQHKIALYGGNFDPPHRGHLLAIRAILAMPNIDEVWVVPSADRPDKTALASKSARLAMLNLLLRTHFQGQAVRLEPCQIQAEVATSYTIDLIRHLQAKHPKFEFIFCLGIELLDQIESWKESSDLCSHYDFLVLPRPGHPLPDKLPSRFEPLICEPNSLVQISSSQVRQLVASNGLWNNLVTAEIAEYICINNLYQD